MIKNLLTLSSLIIAFSSTTYASGIESRVMFSSKAESNVVRHRLVELGNGDYRYTYDPNHCDATGRICTELAPLQQQVNLELISDRSVVDGPRVYGINEGTTLEFSVWTNGYSFCSTGENRKCVDARVRLILSEVN